jgi:hypothetical protein
MTTVPIFYICYSNIEELNVSYPHKNSEEPIFNMALIVSIFIPGYKLFYKARSKQQDTVSSNPQKASTLN